MSYFAFGNGVGLMSYFAFGNGVGYVLYVAAGSGMRVCVREGRGRVTFPC